MLLMHEVLIRIHAEIYFLVFFFLLSRSGWRATTLKHQELIDEHTDIEPRAFDKVKTITSAKYAASL